MLDILAPPVHVVLCSTCFARGPTEHVFCLALCIQRLASHCFAWRCFNLLCFAMLCFVPNGENPNGTSVRGIDGQTTKDDLGTCQIVPENNCGHDWCSTNNILLSWACLDAGVPRGSQVLSTLASTECNIPSECDNQLHQSEALAHETNQ